MEKDVLSNNGCIVISLDFELDWGVKDIPNHDDYLKNILGGRKAIPKILSLFEKHGIHATWATVGMMIHRNKKDVISNLPDIVPNYYNKGRSAYSYSDNIGEDENDDIYNFGGSLLELIRKTDYQEIGSHTYAHYYCLEPGADNMSFECDTQKSIEIFSSYGIGVDSIVFPRNQYDSEKISIINKYGIKCYRGNPDKGFIAIKNPILAFFQRIARTMDSYLPIYGSQTYILKHADFPVNVKASRFFRPYSGIIFLEKLKVARIKKQMRASAKSGQMFHLWWHPHNFGNYTDEMLDQLELILSYYDYLKEKYGFCSLSMREYALMVNKL